MIIDLDAHQGNGPEKDFMHDPDVFIVDAYNPENYPYDFPARKAIAVDIPVYSEDTEVLMLKKYKSEIEKAIEAFKPDFIIYNAGTDCLIGDPLGSSFF
jgi:histone deacetylase 11